MAERPRKPRADLPVFLHASGQYAWKHRRKFHYLGTDPDTAIAEYERTHGWIRAGKVPPALDAETAEGLTLCTLWDRFLEAKRQLRDDGELTAKTYGGYLSLSKHVMQVLGPNRRVVELTAADFLQVRGALSARLGVSTLGKAIIGIRTVFGWGYECGLIDKPQRFGPDFKPPGTRAKRAAKQTVVREHGPRMWSAEEIKAMLGKATLQKRAIVLLAINAAYEPHDLRSLRWDQVDLDLAVPWIEYPRPKTGIDRRVPLWPATVNALAALQELPKKWPLEREFVFITRHGRQWGDLHQQGPLSAEFKTLAEAAGVYRRGVGVLGLRHAFATIAAEGGDQRAVDYVMGHAVHAMSETYRESISDARLIAVCDRVHCWLFGAGVPGWRELGQERLRIVS